VHFKKCYYLNQKVSYCDWMVASASRDKLVDGLVRIGELLMTGEGEAEVDAYFAPDYKFHGPDVGEWD
jgi:hypothetical protein